MDAEIDSALMNACVLGRLFEFVDIESLKNCRLVCHIWNVFAGSSLRNRSVTNFDFVDLVGRLVDADERIQEFQNVIAHGVGPNSKIFKNFVFKLTNWEVKNQHILGILSEIPTIASIKFDLYGCAMLSVDIFNALYQLPNLVSLTLENLPCNMLSGVSFERQKFPKLKYYSFHLGSQEYMSPEPRHELEMLILQSCQNTLQSLTMQNITKYLKFYETVFEDINFQGLTHLRFDFTVDYYPTISIPVNILKKSLSKCPNLRKFECYFDDDTKPEDMFQVLASLKTVVDIRIRKYDQCFDPESLEQAATINDIPTLHSVENFSLNTLFGGDFRDFPSRLPRVKKLELKISKPTFYEWNTMDCLEELSIKQQYPGIQNPRTLSNLTVNNFPRLTKLTITLRTGNAKYIFKNLKNLKELIITKESTITDVDLTGIIAKKLLTKDKNQMIRSKPYIGDLPALQVLYVGSDMITNLSLAYGICEVKKLTHLTLWDPRIERIPITGRRDSAELFYNRLCKKGKKSRQFALKHFMLPRVPYLVQLTVCVPRITVMENANYISVNKVQLQALRKSRIDFSYTQQNEWP